LKADAQSLSLEQASELSAEDAALAAAG